MGYTQYLHGKCVIIILYLFLKITTAELTNTRFCYEKKRCAQNVNRTWKTVCHCDRSCAKYGDCCTDYDTILGPSEYSCRHISGYGSTFLVTACPKEWSNDIIRKQCEDIPETDEEPLTKVPVTHKHSKVTYANIFCALCHENNLSDNIFWSTKLKCPRPSFKIPPGISKYFYSCPHYSDNATGIFNNVTFHNNKKKWGFTIENIFIPCNIDTSLPYLLQSEKQPCFNVVHNCSNETSYKTEEFNKTYIITANDSLTFSLYYASTDEACDSHLHSFLSCLQGRRTLKAPTPCKFDTTTRHRSFCIIFNFSLTTDIPVGKNLLCKESKQVYDNLTKKYFCLNSSIIYSHILEDGKNQTNFNCSKVYFEPNKYTKFDNLTVYIKKYDRNFTNEEFTVVDNNRIKISICEFSNGINATHSPKSTENMNYTTLIGLGISIFFLILHLFVFFFCEVLRKLSDKNLASLCFALLSCYTVFIIMTEVADTGYWWCSAIAFTMYFTLMSSFTWSLAIGFYTWNVLRLSSSECRLNIDIKDTKYYKYALFCWMVPFSLTLVLYILECMPNEVLEQSWKPQVQGLHPCWFHNRFALFIYVAIPSGIIMLVNFVFTFWSLFIIIKTRYDASNKSPQSACLYIRLVISMGLLWSFGFIAGFFDNDILWYFYILCNTLQGLFIFLAFTCRKEILIHLRFLKL